MKMTVEKQIPIFLFILSIFLIIEAVQRDEIELFQKFMKSFNKVYKDSTEEERRLMIFLKNIKLINIHNEKFNKGLSTYSMAINEYADMDEEEFQEYTDGSLEYDDISEHTATYSPPRDTIIPESIDWRTLGAVTRVKKQGKCGSCYAFAATGALEGQHFRKTGKLISLSEQNAIDCTMSLGNLGCKGGIKERVFQYVIQNGGIATEKSYPYEACVNSECLFANATIGTTSYDYVNVTRNDETILTTAVAFNRPISVGVNGTCINSQFYSGGIIDYEGCEPRPISHGMLIVGYGRDSETEQDYWILKNSYGPTWGMDGFVYIPRFRNFAGVASKPSFPLV